MKNDLWPPVFDKNTIQQLSIIEMLMSAYSRWISCKDEDEEFSETINEEIMNLK